MGVYIIVLAFFSSFALGELGALGLRERAGVRERPHEIRAGKKDGMAGVCLLVFSLSARKKKKKTDEKRRWAPPPRAILKTSDDIGGNITQSKSDLPPLPMLFWAKFALWDSPPSKEIEKDGMLLTKEGRYLCDRVRDSLVDRRRSKPHVRQPALFYGINLVPARKKNCPRGRS
ncbi:uncharacterized protein BDZ83DRAFT_158800 [Colletotrichum acutatum]|uniref:Secreted protein n=1 Tax=Glomerella acutata TaxID=27357 RepID=A0AAD8XPX1_GLOAC|nr:uncharacterized protein BDZ83DRAFT_158800 [Colletotrichum acutatum]KAK1731413.1 hypothetical protein BDZ83DRAFT_158800 [Colletotrichum acutatum]